MKIVAIFFLLIGCVSQQVWAQKTQQEFDQMLKEMYAYTVPLLTPSEFSKENPQDFLILDTREKGEYNVSHIPEAVYTGYNNFKKKLLNDIPKDKPILVYCSVGYRSERIGEKLQKMGFTNVYNLYGGIFNWSNEGEKMLDENKAPTQNVHGFNKEWSQWILKGTKVLK